MRILIAPAYLCHHGGFENYVQSLAEVALSGHHDVTVLTPHIVPGNGSVAAGLGGTVNFLSAQQAWRDTFSGRVTYHLARLWVRLRKGRQATLDNDAHIARRRSTRSLERCVAKELSVAIRTADVVHLVGKPKAFLAHIASAASRAGIPIVYSEIAQVSRAYATRPDHSDFMRVANSCDVMLGYYERHAEDLRELFCYRGSTQVVRQWAFQSEKELLQIQIPRPRREIVTFGSLSRLGPEKGLLKMIRAFGAVWRECPDIRLRIGGVGPMKEAMLMELARLGCATAVTFDGFVLQKAAFYESIDAFLICSDEEGGPITGVEALAAGLPVISTPVGAMPEIAGRRSIARVLDTGSEAELAEAIREIGTDPALRVRLGRAARAAYCDATSGERGARDLLALWGELAARQGKPSCARMPGGSSFDAFSDRARARDVAGSVSLPED